MALAWALSPSRTAGAAEDPLALVEPIAGTDASAEDFGTGGGAGNTLSVIDDIVATRVQARLSASAG